MQGGAHRAAERKHMRLVAGHRADVVGGAAEPGDDQEILVPADQLRHRVAAVEHDAGQRLGERGLLSLEFLWLSAW